MRQESTAHAHDGTGSRVSDATEKHATVQSWRKCRQSLEASFSITPPQPAIDMSCMSTCMFTSKRTRNHKRAGGACRVWMVEEALTCGGFTGVPAFTSCQLTVCFGDFGRVCAWNSRGFKTLAALKQKHSCDPLQPPGPRGPPGVHQGARGVPTSS